MGSNKLIELSMKDSQNLLVSMVMLVEKLKNSIIEEGRWKAYDKSYLC